MYDCLCLDHLNKPSRQRRTAGDAEYRFGRGDAEENDLAAFVSVPTRFKPVLPPDKAKIGALHSGLNRGVNFVNSRRRLILLCLFIGRSDRD
jgi:hypothetical protein